VARGVFGAGGDTNGGALHRRTLQIREGRGRHRLLRGVIGPAQQQFIATAIGQALEVVLLAFLVRGRRGLAKQEGAATLLLLVRLAWCLGFP